MRRYSIRLIALAALITLTVGLSACAEGEPDPADMVKAEGPDQLLLAADVERILDVGDVTREEVELNPNATFQATYGNEEYGTFLILNVLSDDQWDSLVAIPTTEPVAGLGEKAVRSSSYGYVFVKDNNLVSVSSLMGHPGEDKGFVSKERLLEIALLIESRM